MVMELFRWSFDCVEIIFQVIIQCKISCSTGSTKGSW